MSKRRPRTKQLRTFILSKKQWCEFAMEIESGQRDGRNDKRV